MKMQPVQWLLRREIGTSVSPPLLRIRKAFEPCFLRDSPRPKPHHHRGVLLIETVICGVLLAVVTTILVPALMGVRRQRQAIQQESLILIELSNQEEHLRFRIFTQSAEEHRKTALSSHPDSSTDPAVASHDQVQPADSQELSEWFLRRYPGSSLSIETIDSPGLRADADPVSGDSVQPDGQADEASQNRTSISDRLQANRITIRCPMPSGQPDLIRSVVVWIPESGFEQTESTATAASEVTE